MSRKFSFLCNNFHNGSILAYPPLSLKYLKSAPFCVKLFIMEKKAILVCENNTGIVEFAQFLEKAGWTIYSNGKTADILKQNDISFKIEPAFSNAPRNISDSTFLIQRILKTKVSGTDSPFESSDNENNYFIVCINFDPIYSSFETIPKVGIGNPAINSYKAALIRNCCTNFSNVLILTDPADYKEALIEIRTDDIQHIFRIFLAGKALNLISAYDAANSVAMTKNNPFFTSPFPNFLVLPYKKTLELSQGPNPQQSSVLYQLGSEESALSGFRKIQGKEVSHKCVVDTSLAWKQVSTLYENLKTQASVPSETCEGYPYTTQFTPLKGTVFSVLIKYQVVVGAALDTNVLDSFKKSLSPDPDSNNKASLACSAVIDADSAREIINLNLEDVIAPGFTDEAREILNQKPELRLFLANMITTNIPTGVILDGGIIATTPDKKLYEKWVIPTKNRPNQKQVDQLALGMIISRNAPSYASILIKDNSMVGIGAGFTSRVKSLENVLYEGKQTFKIRPSDDNKIADVLVCDTSIALTDAVKEMIDRGVSAILQTGGHPQDAEFISYCDEHNISMVFTGTTHYNF